MGETLCFQLEEIIPIYIALEQRKEAFKRVKETKEIKEPKETKETKEIKEIDI